MLPLAGEQVPSTLLGSMAPSTLAGEQAPPPLAGEWASAPLPEVQELQDSTAEEVAGLLRRFRSALLSRLHKQLHRRCGIVCCLDVHLDGLGVLQ